MCSTLVTSEGGCSSRAREGSSSGSHTLRTARRRPGKGVCSPVPRPCSHLPFFSKRNCRSQERWLTRVGQFQDEPRRIMLSSQTVKEVTHTHTHTHTQNLKPRTKQRWRYVIRTQTPAHRGLLMANSGMS